MSGYSDRTSKVAGKVADALGRICDEWVPDHSELLEIDGLTHKLLLTWGGQTVIYRIEVVREGYLP